MATTEPDASTDLDEQEIFGSAVPCQSLIHDLGTWGHDPEAGRRVPTAHPLRAYRPQQVRRQRRPTCVRAAATSTAAAPAAGATNATP